MKNLNQREKEIITNLSKIDFNNNEFFSHHLQSFYFTEDSDKVLVIIPKLNEVIIYLESSVFDDLGKRKNAVGEFLELVSLINYLKLNRYINIFKNNEILNSDVLVIKEHFDNISLLNDKLVLNNHGDYLIPKTPQFIYDSNNNIIYIGVALGQEIFDEIKVNFLGLLIVSEDLKVLVKNNFLLDSEIKFRKQQWLTWLGIFISFIVGFGSLIISCISLNNKSIDNELKIQSSKFDSIYKRIYSIDSKIEEKVEKKVEKKDKK